MGIHTEDDRTSHTHTHTACRHRRIREVAILLWLLLFLLFNAAKNKPEEIQQPLKRHLEIFHYNQIVFPVKTWR